MNQKNILKNLSLSSLALFITVSCVPYPQQNAIGVIGRPQLNNSTSNNSNGNAINQSNPNTGSSSYRENLQPPSNSGYNDPNSYTPQIKKPTYQPPARTIPTLPSTPTRTSSGQYPTATPSIEPNTVISPYAPYNVLTTIGASSGDKMCDPSTIPIDPATGKQYIDPNTGQLDVKRGKYFLVP